jgi:hypothetical protein
MAEGPLAEVGVGHGQGLLLRRHEYVGINVKEAGRALVHRVVQCLQFAHGTSRELEGIPQTPKQRSGWWLLGLIYVPKIEVCPGQGHHGFSWLTPATASDWEVELYERNLELIQTENQTRYPVGGATSARPQLWHPSRLKRRRKRREGFISGNPQTYVLFYKAIRARSGWKLQALEGDEVITLPEEKYG